MTPPAATAAGARTARKPARKPAHARTIPRAPGPRSPRRVSGPLRPKKAVSGRAAAPLREAPGRPRIRRPSISVPARQARRRQAAPLAQRTAAWIRGLPDHALLDRVVRGRSWIVLLGVLLAGIIAMQVEMLKLNASIGRSIQLGTALQSRNELLRANVSELSDEQRIERLASHMGMVMPGPTSINFLEAGRINAGQAAANIHSPDPSGFQSLQPATAPSQVTPLGSTGSGSLVAGPTVTTPGAGTTGTAATTAAGGATVPTPGTTAPAQTTGTSGAPTAAALTTGGATTGGTGLQNAGG
jgi:hypothetical protein